MNKTIIKFTMVAIALLLSGCNLNSQSSAENNNQNHNDEIKLTAFLDNSSEVQNHINNTSLTPNALINFNKAVDPSSINNKSVFLKDSYGNLVKNYQIILQGNKLALNVDKPLSGFTQYTITLTSQITDKARLSHLDQTTFDFTTGNEVYPVAYLLSPCNLDNASQTPNISFDFNSAVKNVDTSTVSLLDDAGNKVEISDIVNTPLLGSDDVSARFYNFFPKKPLLPNKHYHIILSSDITDLSGNHLKPTEFDMMTGTYIKPEILLKSPRQYDTDVSQNPSFEFNISGGSSEEPDSFTNIDSDHIYLIDAEDSGNNHINLAFTKGSSNNNYVATIKDENHPALLANRKYVLVFSPEISDHDGNHIASELTIEFTTGNSIIPDVSMIEPINNASDISQKPTLTFFFAGAIGGMQNVDSDSIYLIKDSGGSKINLSIVSNGDGLANNYVATLADDSKPLAANTTYNIVFSSNIQDKFGNHIKQVNYHFKTGDTMYPTAAIISPADKAVNITKHPLIQMQFSTLVNLAKNKNVLLLDDKKNIVQISDIDYFSEKKVGDSTYKNVYSFNPVAELDAKKTYTLKLTSDITDTLDEPNHLKDTYFIFTTNEKNNPTAFLMQPYNNATGVSSSQLIKVRFSTAVQGASNDTVTLHEDSPDGKVILMKLPLSSTDNMVFTMHPSELQAVTKYYVTFSEKISSVNTDDHMVNPTPQYFTTGNSKNPTVQLVYPKSNKEQVSIRTPIKFAFSTPVSGVSNSTISLNNCKRLGADTYSFSISSNADGSEYEITPDKLLPANQKICLNLKSGIVDNANTPVDATQLSFTTGDKVIPTVYLTSGVSSVAVNSVLELSFSDVMKNVNANISLHKGSSTGPNIDFKIDSDNQKVYKIKPARNLDFSASYYVVIAENITDIDGNPLPPQFINFTTRENKVPLVSLTSNKLMNINDKIQLTFSEQMNDVGQNISLHKDSPTGNKIDFKIASTDQKVYNLTPISSLEYDSSYYIVINNGITDKDGNILNSQSITLNTRKILDITYQGSWGGSADVVKLEFANTVQQVVDHVSLHAESIDGNTIPIALEQNNNIYNISQRLTERNKYCVVVDKGIVDITGLAVPSQSYCFIAQHRVGP